MLGEGTDTKVARRMTRWQWLSGCGVTWQRDPVTDFLSHRRQQSLSFLCLGVSITGIFFWMWFSVSILMCAVRKRAAVGIHITVHGHLEGLFWVSFSKRLRQLTPVTGDHLHIKGIKHYWQGQQKSPEHCRAEGSEDTSKVWKDSDVELL